jgi:hypothetical protein
MPVHRRIVGRRRTGRVLGREIATTIVCRYDTSRCEYAYIRCVLTYGVLIDFLYLD